MASGWDAIESRPPPGRVERRPDEIEPPTAEMLAAVEHDLYDALAVVIARSQLLSRRLTTGRAEPADVVEGLAAIERAARRMVTSVGRLAGDDGPTVSGLSPAEPGGEVEPDPEP